ncbi:MAG TPA: tetratricopeptide repeat protein [Verrucomicrobiae bacterium]
MSRPIKHLAASVAKHLPSARTPVARVFILGVTFVSVILIIALIIPQPTAFQNAVFRIILALAAAGVAAEIPGVLRVKISNVLTGSGAFALFAVVYFYSPAQLVIQPEDPRRAALDDKYLVVLRKLAETLAQSGQTAVKVDEATLLARTYAILEAEMKLPAGTLKRELPGFAEQLLKRKDTIGLDRANAFFAVKKFPEAEAAALEVKAKALASAGQPVRDAINALLLAGQSARAQAHYATALDHFLAAADLADQKREPALWARAQHLVAQVRFDLGEYPKAAELLKSVIETRKRVLGPVHRDTLTSRNNLAEAFRAQGMYSEAEKEHYEVFVLRENTLGEEHEDTLASRENVALAIQSQGRYPEAETQHRAVLEIETRVLGAEHPYTLASRNNLAVALYAQEKYAEAEAEHREVLEIRERRLPKEHPDVLTSRMNLASVMFSQRKYREAEDEYRMGLAMKECVLGPEHPDTLASRMGLANSLHAQGRDAEAEAEHRAILGARERVLRAEHPDVFVSCFNIAVCLEAQGKRQDALGFARRALTGWRMSLGDRHPDTVDARGLVEELERPQ